MVFQIKYKSVSEDIKKESDAAIKNCLSPSSYQTPTFQFEGGQSVLIFDPRYNPAIANDSKHSLVQLRQG